MPDRALVLFEGRFVAYADWTGERWLLVDPEPGFLSALPLEVIVRDVSGLRAARASIEADAGLIYARELPDA